MPIDYVAIRALITADEVRALLAYESETGIFRWKARSGGLTKTFNAKHAGRRAGAVGQNGYRYITIHKTPMFAHRLAWLVTHGRWPSSQADHINTNRDDNRIKNLREATHSQNMRNRSGLVRKLAPKGAVWNRRDNRWQASICVDGKRLHLGKFVDQEDAAAAYRHAAQEHFGEYARFA